jgi:hypothetical protein
VRQRHRELSLQLLRVMRRVDLLEGRFASAMGYWSSQQRGTTAELARQLSLLESQIAAAYPGELHASVLRSPSGLAVHVNPQFWWPEYVAMAGLPLAASKDGAKGNMVWQHHAHRRMSLAAGPRIHLNVRLFLHHIPWEVPPGTQLQALGRCCAMRG